MTHNKPTKPATIQSDLKLGPILLAGVISASLNKAGMSCQLLSITIW